MSAVTEVRAEVSKRLLRRHGVPVLDQPRRVPQKLDAFMRGPQTDETGRIFSFEACLNTLTTEQIEELAEREARMNEIARAQDAQGVRKNAEGIKRQAEDPLFSPRVDLSRNRPEEIKRERREAQLKAIRTAKDPGWFGWGAGALAEEGDRDERDRDA